MDNIMLVYMTAGSKNEAMAIANELVENHLAACVNIVPGLTSVYQWQGKLEKDNEVLLLIKTQEDRYNQLEALIQQAHPYELPEVVAIDISTGSERYLAWLDESLKQE